MRKLWKAIKLFHVPMTHPYIQGLTEHDLSFIAWSEALDDPEFVKKLENTYYDDEFEEWANEELSDDTTVTSESDSGEDLDQDLNNLPEKTKSSGSQKLSTLEDNEYIDIPSSDSKEVNDWEEVE